MQRPLAGTRVLSLGQYMSAPYCTMLLADAGAEIIKVERPGTGDPRRVIAPFAESEDGEHMGGGFMAYNRNKKSVALNLKADRGRKIFKDLAKTSDVVVENMRPGVTARLGVGYEALKEINPGLVYTAISGFGQLPELEGPYTDRPAFDIVVEAMSGIMHLVGYEDGPPQWTIYGLADLHTGLVAAFSTLLALFMRERTGEGQFVDAAMYDSMLALNERMVMLYTLTGQMQPRGRMRYQGPRAAFKAADGYLAFNVPDDVQWRRLCEAIGREDLIDDPRTAEGPARGENAGFVRSVIEEWLVDKTREEARAILGERGVPTGPVHTADEIFNCPQVEARQMLVDVEDEAFGTYKFARSPMTLSAAPTIEAKRAPRLGEHTRPVLQELLGYDDAELDVLEAEEVIQAWSG
ncbi:MAG: Succinyl-CoA--L-malate CoA-transferase beta subunit [Anaerolineales bacterium]|nr:Succinyl-CoA--L-malate CoA-transferase beta subunit [Anaerolineales bacterium]